MSNFIGQDVLQGQKSSFKIAGSLLLPANYSQSSKEKGYSVSTFAKDT